MTTIEVTEREAAMIEYALLQYLNNNRERISDNTEQTAYNLLAKIQEPALNYRSTRGAR